MEHLPMYDSLVLSIMEKLPVFLQNIDTSDSYQAFRYVPGSGEKGFFYKLPASAGLKIDYYFTKLGKDLIYRFDVFKDSTVKIYIRNTESEKNMVYIVENLSYYPRQGTLMQPRTFPAKDTVLTPHWQYWMRVEEPRLF
jgi:hypothetical protein